VINIENQAIGGLCSHRTVVRQSSIGGLYVCARGLCISAGRGLTFKFEKNSTNYSVSYFNLGGLELCLEGG